jgi:hypothetical protein
MLCGPSLDDRPSIPHGLEILNTKAACLSGTTIYNLNAISQSFQYLLTSSFSIAFEKIFCSEIG